MARREIKSHKKATEANPNLLGDVHSLLKWDAGTDSGHLKAADECAEPDEEVEKSSVAAVEATINYVNKLLNEGDEELPEDPEDEVDDEEPELDDEDEDLGDDEDADEDLDECGLCEDDEELDDDLEDEDEEDLEDEDEDLDVDDDLEDEEDGDREENYFSEGDELAGMVEEDEDLDGTYAISITSNADITIYIDNVTSTITYAGEDEASRLHKFAATVNGTSVLTGDTIAITGS